MKLPKERSAATARDAKRRLENPLTEAQKDEKAEVDAERLRKIQRTADKNSERLRAMAERRSAPGAEGLAAKASRKSTHRNSHPLTVDEKAEKARADVKRRNVASAEFSVADAIRKNHTARLIRRRLSKRLKRQWRIYAMQSVIDNLCSLLSKNQKKLELKPKDGMRKAHKLQLFD
jgi:hypothetical protein